VGRTFTAPVLDQSINRRWQVEFRVEVGLVAVQKIAEQAAQLAKRAPA
jgi:hypothetical protein